MSISFDHVYFSYPTANVLEDVSFSCGAGERLCVVGPNGSGKTTLLKLASHELSPLQGMVTSPVAHGRGGDVSSAFDGNWTVGEVLNEATAGVRSLLHEFDELSQRLGNDQSEQTLRRYDELLGQLTQVDAWSLDARVQRTLDRLGLGAVAHDRPVATLSPGQQGRLDLASLLLRGDAALVLDEPTNHLDREGREFLIETLRVWNGPVLFASHDRAFIERVATGILDLDTAPWRALATAQGRANKNGIHRCAGKYSDYLREKAAAREAHVQIHALQRRNKDELIQHRRESEVVGHRHFTPRTEVRMAQKFFADRAQTVSTRRITDDSHRLEKLAEVEVRKPRYDSIRIDLPEPLSAPSGIACSIRNAEVPGRLAPVSFELSGGEHLMLTGQNGSGKSTLLHWIHHGQAPTSDAAGQVLALGTVLVPQELPGPGEELVPASAWESGVGEVGKGFLHPRFWATPLADLSDGNQRRAQIAFAMAQRPGFLIIDEPTNYLDLDTIESLEAALMRWDGTLIIATHDEWLISKWAEVPAQGEVPRRCLALR